MFAFLTRRDPAPPAPTGFPPLGDASPLLRHLAGPLANRVAGLWPAPHADFVTATAARRHLVLIAIARVGDRPLPIPHELLLEEALKKAIALAVPNAPEGLGRALAHLGELGWEAEDYARLLHVLRLDSKQVRHAKAITPEYVRALSSLPEPLIRARVGGFGLSEPSARLLAEAFRLIARREGLEAAGAHAVRWSKSESAKALFETVEDDLLPPFPLPPFAGSERLRPVTTKADLRAVALRYRNCLRHYMASVANGRSAIYEWKGKHPTVIEIVQDEHYGWRLNEARVHQNGSVPEETQRLIRKEMEAMGVHVGLSTWQLQNALSQAQSGQAWFPDVGEEVRWVFED